MPDHEIILYHYSFSPFARRVVWYLTLRKIPYKQCIQPPTLPRPDTAALGTKYRRIPLLSINSSIYLDTRLILQKLESLYPPSPSHPSISPSTPPAKALRTLLESWIIDAGGFTRGGQLIPSDMPLLKDEKFQRDREDYTGRSWSREAVEKGRGEALVDMRSRFKFLEEELLGDGRIWVGGTEGPGILDIEAVWIPHWLRGLKGALRGDYISSTQFPKVFDWVERFDAAAKAAAAVTKAPKISVDEALAIVEKGNFPEVKGEVESGDPSGLSKGEEVEVWPTDSGFNHKDRGRLLKLDGGEIVVEGKTRNGKMVRIHAPRHGFRVRRVGAKI